MSIRSVLFRALPLLVMAVVAPPASALTLEFSTTVQSVGAGLPPSLVGVTVGDPISGQLSFDPSAPSAANPFSGTYSTATYYPLPGASFSVNIGGAVFSSWSGTIVAFVWNDEPTVSAGTNDGVLFTNLTAPSTAQFQLGNLILSTSVLASDALPSSAPGGIHVLGLGPAGAGSSWIDSDSFTFTQVVPEPSTYVLLALGLPMLAWGVKRTGAARVVRLASQSVG
jgi:hypothetical protein